MSTSKRAHFDKLISFKCDFRNFFVRRVLQEWLKLAVCGKKTALDGKWEVSYLGCSNGGAWKVCRLSRMCKCIGWGIEVDRERELADS